MTAYYNEIDKQKAAWLRELIRAELIAPGDVDERSIADVNPAELMGYTQCHFFAGIGAWSYALRLAGWPDKQSVWTGSCPCPSFSVAGKGEGFDDPRHLWPAWHRLIRECRPGIVFGEQADGAIGHGWLDLVQRNMETEGYAVAAAVLGAHSAGAPHIRQRLYFVGADTNSGRQEARRLDGRCLEPGGQVQRLDSTNGAEAPIIRATRSGSDTAGSGHDGWRSGETSTGIEAAIRCNCERESERLRHAGIRSHAADARCDDAGQHGSGLPLLSARPEQCGNSGQRANTDGGKSCDGDVQRGGEQRLLAEDCGTGHVERCPVPLHPERRPQLFNGNNGCDGQDAGRDQTHGIAGTRGEVLRSGDTAQRGQPMCGSAPGIAGHAALTSQSGSGDQSLSPRLEGYFGDVREWRGPGWLDPLMARSVAEAGATRGFWGDCDWWYGRDGRYRPAGPGVQPLAHGSAARVVRLRGYGDAINVYSAKAFIEAYREISQ